MRILLVFIVFLVLNAEDSILEINALKFSANEKEGIIELKNNVKIKKGKDELYAPKVVINVDKKNNPTQYTAYGGVIFVVVTKDNRYLRGRANEVHYNATNGEYKLVGNSEIKEDNKVNVVVGEEIIVNNEVGYVNITGTTNKPAKLIFKMEKKDE